MGLVAKGVNGRATNTPLEPGTYPARCMGVVDLGLQEIDYQGQKMNREKVLILWELPTERVETDKGDEARVFSKRYTLSLNERAALRKDIDSWRGKPFTDEEIAGFDLRKVINAPCMLSIVNVDRDSNTYTRITSVARVMRGLTVPELEHEPLIFDMESPDADGVYEQLPPWIQRIIDKSPTWKDRLARQNTADKQFVEDMNGDEGDLPF